MGGRTMNKENEKKSFRYGGYTFVPSGKLKDYGYDPAKDDAYYVLFHLFDINRGFVADGHEKYSYDEFYDVAKAAGCGDADVFYCPQTQELYVPHEKYLAIFDKTATEKEVKRRFEKRRVDAPITEGADLQSDALFDDLFDDGNYMDNQRTDHEHEVLGFIGGEPVMVKWWLGLSKLTVRYLRGYNGQLTNDERIETLRDALTGEEVEPEIKRSESDADTLNVLLYYTPAYVAENFAPAE